MLRTPTPEETTRLTRWRVSTFWVCLLGYVGYYLCRKNLSVALPLISADLGFSKQELGLVVAISEIAYAIGKLVNGPLGDKIGGRRIFLIGMLGAIAFNVVFALGGSLAWFGVAWCLCRYFLSMGWGGLVKTIGEWYEPRRNGTIMGLISVNFQFGGAAAAVFAAAVLKLDGATWQDVFFFPAGALFIVFVWSLLASRAKPSDVIPGVRFGGEGVVGRERSLVDLPSAGDGAPSVRATITALLRVSAFRHLLGFSFLTTLMRTVFFLWTPTFLFDTVLADPAATETERAIRSGLQSTLFPFMGAIGTILLGWFTDQPGRRDDRGKVMWMMLLACCACLVGIAWIARSGSTDQAALLVGLTGFAGFFFLGPYSMSSGALTLDIAGAKGAGSSSGLIDGVGYFGGALGAYLGGGLAEAHGWSTVFGALALVALLSSVSAMGLSGALRRNGAR